MTTTSESRKTPLNAWHRRHKARMVDFGGWDVPIEYSGIIQEHMAVRTTAGLFDVSHMGEILIEGPEALPLVQSVTSNDASKLQDGQIQYSALLYPEGTFVDDILVHRFSAGKFFLCVNASNTEKDFNWISRQNQFSASVLNVSSHYAQIALQGPQANSILRKLTDRNLGEIKYYWFTTGLVSQREAIISRTGYTGEDGFELYLAPEEAEPVWQELMNAGQEAGLVPAGLGARNTLRLEAKMALYGHEISDQITPWEAGLAWIVKLNKGDFIGRKALLEKREAPPAKKLVGFEMSGREIARDGYPAFFQGVQSGYVTSGSPSPFLKKNIGLAYLPVAAAEVGQSIEIQIRSRLISATVASTPFYERR
jgi:aminomethyltransferase